MKSAGLILGINGENTDTASSKSTLVKISCCIPVEILVFHIVGYLSQVESNLVHVSNVPGLVDNVDWILRSPDIDDI